MEGITLAKDQDIVGAKKQILSEHTKTSEAIQLAERYQKKYEKSRYGIFHGELLL